MPIKKTKKALVSKVQKTESKKVEKVAKSTKIDSAEAKADKKVEQLTQKLGFIDQIIEAPRLQNFLNLDFMNQANTRVRKNLEKICKIIGWIGLILGIIAIIFSIIAFVIGIIGLFAGAVLAFLLSVIVLASNVLLIASGRGMIKMKKWLPKILVLAIMLGIVSTILSLIVANKGGSSLRRLIFDVVFTAFCIKNRDLFQN